MKRSMRVAAAILAAAMALAMTGCGAKASGDSVPEKKVTLGKLENGVYTNDYLGVTFAPEDWQMQGADELQDSLKDVGEILEDTEVGEKLEGLEQFMDLQAVAPSGLVNVNIVYTKMGTAERLANLALDEDAAMDSVLQQKDTIISSYEAAGITVDSMEKADCTYGGQQRTGIKTVGSVQGIPCYMLQVYERTLGAYSVVITVTSFQEDHTGNIAEMFQSVTAQ